MAFQYDGVYLFRDVSFTVKPGDVVIISGRSGHGKSTLLELCAALRHPFSGRVLWNGKNIEEFSKREILLMRRSMGYVFQSHALISNHTVFDNIALPLRSVGGFPNSFIEREVKRYLREFGIEGIERVYPEVLSSGQLKAVAVARALISKPRILFLDEPLSGVDPLTAQDILKVLYSCWEIERMSVILIAHNLNVWNGENVRKFLLNAGKLENAQNYARIDREYNL
ncbi:ABC transporter, ATP-binding protein [Chitinispirillum alkaliphilum]|nr:ABC transporter, ATP-binding protein [Chitinispirillum alkaliphilum]